MRLPSRSERLAARAVMRSPGFAGAEQAARAGLLYYRVADGDGRIEMRDRPFE